MTRRHTKKELGELSDIKFAICILNERMNGLNRYAPLASKLKRSIRTLEGLDQPEKRDWWTISFTNEDGEKRQDGDVGDDELARIGRLVAEGYVGGEIYSHEEVEDDD